MPDRKTEVTVNPESGTVKAVVPAQEPRSVPTDTRVETTPGTHEHQVMIQDVPHTEEIPHVDEQPERRRGQPTFVTQIQQPNAGGLTGWRAQLANMSAVGVVIVFLFLVYRDSKADQREAMAQMREEFKQNRADSQSANAAMVVALSGLTTSNNSMVSEMRQARQEMSALVKLMSKEVKERESENEHGFAPMPRVKADGGGQP